MKRFLTLSAFLLLASVSFAQVEIDGIYYNLSETEAEVTCYKDIFGYNTKPYTGTVVIPKTVVYRDVTYNVTAIGSGAFSNCHALVSLTIPSSVTTITSSAFEDCSLSSIIVDTDNPVYDSRNNCNAIIKTKDNELIVGCQKTMIPSDVVSIGDWAFDDCTYLMSITIPNSVKNIGSHAFDYCKNLASIIIPNSVTTIGDYAFSESGISSATIGNGVTKLEDNIFNECKKLTSVIIPNSVTSIGSSAFSGCSGLTSVTIPNSVTSIGSYAFYGCGLTSITIGDGVTTIGRGAFYNCSELAAVKIPSSVTEIGDYAFGGGNITSIIVNEGNPVFDSRGGCNAIIKTESNELIAGCQTTVIPNSVTSIGKGAFIKKGNLSTITIPNSITSIGEEAFEWCYDLTSINIPANVSSIGKNAFRGDEKLHVTLNSQHLLTYNFGIDCFHGDAVEYILGEGITTIPSSTFQNCTGMESVIFPNSLKKIEDEAFQGCKNLKKVRFPNGLEYIGSAAFSDCSELTTVTIPNSVTSIDWYAFRNCLSLTDVNALMNIPKVLNSNVFSCNMSDYDFYTVYYITNLHVPRGRTTIYQNVDGWKLFTSITEKDVAYEILYLLDGMTYKSYEIQPGMTITPEGAPVKDGYVFSGWDTVPDIMPEHDVIVYGYLHPVTEIKHITIEEKRTTQKGIYTLQGVKVSDDAGALKQLPRGIYIVNGRKVAVK